MHEDMKSLYKDETWDLVKTPKSKSVIGFK